MVLRALFYYLLGGVTFLPLCFVAGYIYFVSTCEKVEEETSSSDISADHRRKDKAQALGDVDLSPALKAQALELAAKTAAASSRGSINDESSAAAAGIEIPPSARRLGGGTAGSASAPTTASSTAAIAQSRTYRAGMLTVRRQFYPAGSAEAQLAASLSSSSYSSSGIPGGELGSGASGTDGNTVPLTAATAAAVAAKDLQAKKAAGGGGYLSGVYRGLLDYRKAHQSQQHHGLDDEPGSSAAGAGASAEEGGSASASGWSAPGAAGSGSATPHASSASTSGKAAAAAASAAAQKEQFHCILKGPILYLYTAPAGAAAEAASTAVSGALSSSGGAGSTVAGGGASGSAAAGGSSSAGAGAGAAPPAEVHAAIDLRGKRVTIYMQGLGDVAGEPWERPRGSQEDDDDDDDEDDDRAGEARRRPGAQAEVDEPSSSAALIAGGEPSAGEQAQNQQKKLTERAARSRWRRSAAASVRDGELFMKRNAIRIVGKLHPALATPSGASVHGGGGSGGGHKGQYTEWYVFAKSATLLEDWYLALVHASLIPQAIAGEFGGSLSRKSGAAAAASSSGSSVYQPESITALPSTIDPVGPLFSVADMTSLLASLDTVPDPIPLRWLNAMLGRVFFGVYRTAWLEEYVTRKLMKKISRVKTPSFLSDVKVVEVDLGRSPPAFSRPMLKTLTGEGEASMEVSTKSIGVGEYPRCPGVLRAHNDKFSRPARISRRRHQITLHYTGALRLTISTNLTISLGSRFKSYTVSLVLAVVLRSLEGNLLLLVKPPPSNRLWFGFTQMPKMELSIEPVVSERKVQWGMVTRIIESRIREMVSGPVTPNWRSHVRRSRTAHTSLTHTS